MTADHDDDRTRILLLDPPQGLEPVDPRHFHVEEHEMRFPLGVLAYPVHGVGDGPHFITFELEQLPECGADALFVVDNEDAPHEWLRGTASRMYKQSRILSRKPRRGKGTRNADSLRRGLVKRDAAIGNSDIAKIGWYHDRQTIGRKSFWA